jgi:hypothetical protein
VDDMRPEEIDPDAEEASVGFFVRWVMPLLLVVVIALGMMVLARVSIPAIELGQELPEGHFSTACGVCHRTR